MALKYSRQRTAIWDYIKDRKDHPTADMVYEGVRKDYPKISLGTVYRNLMLMKDIGKIRTVEVGDGAIHFDPNVSEHDHFICSCCGKVIDIDGEDIARIKELASRNFSGRIDGYSAFFYGICEECIAKTAHAEPVPSSDQEVLR
ncbi:MAG: transcriptional repressor [Lachnospiraceae bacterium]|nr:transcriptional repressor [Lachnospiraceae bacterium]